MRAAFLFFVAISLSACASFPNRDRLEIDVAGIEPLPSEGLELRLQVSIRVQNPNDSPVEFTGAAINLDLNGRRLASGVSAIVGTVPRYGETVFAVPVTISAFNVARQLLGFMSPDDAGEIRYRVRGKLEGGLLRTRRFDGEGTISLDLAAN